MKQIILIFVALLSLQTRAQQIVRIDSNEIFKTFLNLSTEWCYKGTDIVTASQSAVTRLRLRGNAIIEENPIPFNEFLTYVTSTLDVPVYDSNGIQIGFNKKEYQRNINAFCVSTSASLSGKIGFSINPASEEQLNHQDLFFVNAGDFSVLKNLKMKLFPSLILQTAVSNPDCSRADYFTEKKQREKLVFFPVGFANSEFTGLKSMARTLLHQYNEDLIETHYRKNIKSYFHSTDRYHNTFMEALNPLYDTILKEEGHVSDQNKMTVKRRLSDPPDLGISLYIDRTVNTSEGIMYAGIPYPVYTSSGIYLGEMDLFLERKDREKHFRPSSRLLEQLLARLYE